MSPLISRDEAWGLIAPLARALEPERVPLAEAVGRPVAEDVTCPIDIPGFDRSAMDGYALRSADTPGVLRLAGEVGAGDVASDAVQPQTTVRIFTGGAIPPGADAVQRQEDVSDRGDGTVELAAPVPPGHHIRRRGEDVPQGSVLLQAGAVVTPQSLTVLAAAGLAELPVRRRARVAILLTGDELVQPGKPLAPGQIYETSGVTLRTYAKRAGAEVLDLGTAPDNPRAIGNRVELGLARADILLVAGGVSVGDRDHVKGVFSDAGIEELFWGVRIKPGKPVFCGRKGGKWAFGLPGNPLSGIVSFLAFVEPLLRRMHGEPDAVERRVRGRVTTDIEPQDGRTTYFTATFATAADGVTEATPTRAQGSAMTLALALADGFVIAPDGAPAVSAGSVVDLLPL